MTTPARTATIAIEVSEGDDPNEIIYSIRTEDLAGGEENLLRVLDAITARLRKSL